MAIACLPSHLLNHLCFIVGPKVEAFRFECIVLGLALSLASQAYLNAGDWYEIVCEAFTELGVFLSQTPAFSL